MNLAYFRNSTRNARDTIAQLKTAATEKGFSVIGESALPGGKATVVTVCRPDWAQAVVEVDPNLLGLLPCSAVVMEKDGKVTVGAGTPALLGQVVRTEKIQQLAESAETALRSVVETAAGVAPLKPTQLILYSSHTCPFCMMEKTWLDRRKTTYKLIYVDDDQQAAQSLVERSGQTGVPMTEVVYDNGETEFIVGFDRVRLDKIIKAM